MKTHLIRKYSIEYIPGEPGLIKIDAILIIGDEDINVYVNKSSFTEIYTYLQTHFSKDIYNAIHPVMKYFENEFF